MQYKVPQNVDIEDKVIGPLSLRQFMIILIGVSIIIVLNFVFVGFLRILFWLFAMLIAAVSLSFAFVKYGDQKLEIFAAGAYKTLTSARKRVWQKTDDMPQMVQKTTEKPKEGKITRNVENDRNDLERLAQLVDAGGYSKVDLKDRIALAEVQKPQETTASDLIAQSEKPDQEIDNLIKDTKTSTQKEPLISEVASISPQKKYNYPKIDLAKGGILEKFK